MYLMGTWLLGDDSMMPCYTDTLQSFFFFFFFTLLWLLFYLSIDTCNWVPLGVGSKAGTPEVVHESRSSID